MYDGLIRTKALALLADGLSLNQVSRTIGVSRAAIREWRDRGVAADPHFAACVRCDPEQGMDNAGYAGLLGFYLGDGCISRLRATYSLRVFCDSAYPHIIQDVTALIRAVHPIAGVCLVVAPGMTVVQNSWKHWPCLFPQHGPGRKHERELGMTDWQWAIIERHPADFLRGLFHSDGSRSKNWTRRIVAGRMKRYDYPRWEFTNHSTEIRRWCQDTLDLLGIPWRPTGPYKIAVSRREGVARLDELIGPKC
jgi:hypothetical protein